ncbi:MAG: EAL domain-containing protein [Xanthomonadaceae bacterium]|nr:EAL domain-containing protein [Xanthomonadaceae bacterium]
MTAPATNPLRVLIVDDDEDDYILCKDLLEALPGWRVTAYWAPSYRAGLDALANLAHDAYLVDYRLGPETGLDWLEAAKPLEIAAPVILLTGGSNPDIEQAALRGGAADFLVKGEYDAEGLSRCLRYALERSRLLAQLSSEQKRYRVLFERAPVPMFICEGEDCHLTLSNQAASELYGYSADEFNGMPAFSLWSPDQRDAVYQQRESMGSGRTMVGQHQRKDGQLFDVKLMIDTVQLDDRPAHVLKVADITLQLRAERAMREQTKQLRKVLADVADGLLVVDGDNRIRLANGAAGDILGTPADRLEGYPLALSVTTDEGAEDISLFHADGRRSDLETRTAHTVWEGEPARIVTIRDVTEPRRTQQQMRLLERAIEASHSAVLIADARQPDLPTIYVNQAFEDMTGYTVEESLGRNCRFLQGDDRQQPEVASMRAALERGEDCHVQLRNYRKSGELFWNQLTLSPVRDGEGQISHYLGISTDISREVQQQQQLAELANRDPVTQMPLFAGLKQEIESQLAAANQDNDAFAVILIDIDQFDNVNRSMGHDYGDQALRLLAQRMEECIGVDGRLCRLAADVFLALIPCAGRSLNPAGIAEKLRDQSFRTLHLPPYDLTLTCTIGVALYPDHADSLNALLNCAQMAMRRGKRAGRNAVVVFRPEFSEELRDRIALGSKLRDAVVDGEMRLHFQPQVSGQDGRIIGLEALVRWQSPEHGLIMPSRFIDVAEDLGIIVPLGKWVLRETCRVLRGWIEAGHEDIFVSVNVSAQQLLREQFCAEVIEILDEYGVPARMLEIEITESAIVENIDRVRTIMLELRRHGIRLALDDFGTGYSSLNYLKQLPIDKLKIDRCFVSDITVDSNDAAIARAIIAMGHQLRMSILAEGIETLDQLGFLRRNHCDMFQGYLLGRPVDAEATTLLLRGRHLLPDAFEATRPDRVLLLVDDEENILRSLVRLFRREGYTVLTANTVDQAFSLLASHHVQVILSDQRMPDCSGTEFLGRVKDLYPNTIRMILSGYTDLSTVTDAINRGSIYRFLTKPWDDNDLRAHIREAFRFYEQAEGVIRPESAEMLHFGSAAGRH